jgi:hypothetical protein
MEETQQPEDELFEVELTTRSEYIAAAFNAIAAVDNFDPQIMNGADQARIRRIKRKALRMIDACLCEMYDEMFEDDEEDAN